MDKNRDVASPSKIYVRIEISGYVFYCDLNGPIIPDEIMEHARLTCSKTQYEHLARIRSRHSGGIDVI